MSLLLLVVAIPFAQSTLAIEISAPPQPPGMVTTDRLAEPPLPESPTQVEIGRHAYYFHCMPCHGDRGQGLTDEWREVWVEDHQNCWGRNCHTGNSELAAFYIPRSVPAVVGPPGTLASFQTPEALFEFLLRTQPPQRPGALTEEEYWALTAFLLHENGQQPEGAELGQGYTRRDEPCSQTVAVAAVGLPLVMLFVAWTGKQQRA
jgi:cytochrome c